MIDVDGVIVSGRPSDGRRWDTDLAGDLALNPVALREAFFKPHWEDIVTGRVGLSECLAGVLADVAPGVSPAILKAYWFQNDSRLNEPLLRDLALVRLKGLRIHLATNQEHERASYLMNALGLAAYVDGCHYSAAIGHRKPRPEFFRAVMQRVALQPSELLLIDDSGENVRAATKAGWHATHWTGNQTLSEILAGVFREGT